MRDEPPSDPTADELAQAERHLAAAAEAELRLADLERMIAFLREVDEPDQAELFVADAEIERAKAREERQRARELRGDAQPSEPEEPRPAPAVGEAAPDGESVASPEPTRRDMLRNLGRSAWHKR